MNYISVSFKNISPEKREQLIYYLSVAGADGFEEKEDGLEAWFPETNWPESEIKELSRRFNAEFTLETIPETNWNETWEQNYPPVEISGKCYIRAPFHPKKDHIKYEIIIEPKMSFGTAHHETTSQMISTMLKMDFRTKTVLDMGCGTGILAILAEKMGAVQVLAVDNDEWAIRNAADNIAKNNCTRISVKKGETDAVTGHFDIILANINRNILLEQIPSYSSWLLPGSKLLMSGFYKEDLDAISGKASKEGLLLVGSVSENNWVAALFEKK